MENREVYSIIVPLYNEEVVIEESYRRIKAVMESTKEGYEIIFVNDGSRDKTRYIAENLCLEDKTIKLINFSRNFGHQAAITAGMNEALGDAVVVIDADLQDPPEVILEMIKKWKQGYDVVYGKRTKREGEKFLKKFTAKVFYRILKNMTSVDIPVDTGDFRLIDRKVCDALNSLPEKNRYVRGLVSWVGYKQTFVEFTRQGRFAGETKYPFKKMIKLALDGITSFSYKPITMIGSFGGFIFFIGIISTLGVLIKNISSKTAVLSLGLIMAVNFIMFGLIFISIGIMGEYIGRISDEAKERPMYIIESKISYENKMNLYNTEKNEVS
ncbi:glycosyltransferase family 2 protein [Clostridium hydrogenum]|uniref:glycosyltransferase family 2 protein n=1 Tax=Clostridium hydrogenum TaxID=2855764 RepID=UPI001F455763|nr:glycosyltransferase family 2 protein [Clostridium hydrogenum]